MTKIIDKSGFSQNKWDNYDVPSLEAYQGGPTVELPVDQDPSVLADHFDALKLIVVPFASSADGRGFSLAAELRDLGFKNHIRAKGHIIVDQFRAALRSGFSDLEISDEQAERNPENQWLSVSHENGYQTRLLAA